MTAPDIEAIARRGVSSSRRLAGPGLIDRSNGVRLTDEVMGVSG